MAGVRIKDTKKPLRERSGFLTKKSNLKINEKEIFIGF